VGADVCSVARRPRPQNTPFLANFIGGWLLAVPYGFVTPKEVAIDHTR